MKSVGKAISLLIAAASSVAGVMVLLLVLHVTLDVLMRYVFETPLNSTILYVSAFYMVAVAFMPLGLVEEKNSHIAVELLAEKFPSKVQHVLLIFATILTAVVTATVAVRTGQEAIAKYNTGAFSIEAGGKVITWPTYFFLPLGFGLMSVVAGWKVVALITGKDSGFVVPVVEDPYMSKETPDV